MVAVGVLMSGVGQAEVQGVAQTGGPPLLPIPQFLETGLPSYTMPVGRPSEPSPPASGGGTTDPGGDGTGTGGTGDGADSPSMAAMTGRSWGAAAAQNAETVGVTPVSVAATCMIEAGGCQTNPGIPGANGTINGTFQMTDAIYRDMMASALARNPSLAANVVQGLAGKLDPATQSIAAAEYQRQGAVYLQAHDIANPTVLDVRGYYNFGPAAGAAIASAADSALMSSQLPSLSNAQLRANGITPGLTTVGQWRATVTRVIGGSAAQSPVLLSRS